MTVCEVVFHGPSQNILNCLVGTNSMLSDFLNIMLKFVRMFKLEYGCCYTETKADGIDAELRASNVLSEARSDICYRHIFLEKNMLRCFTVLSIVQSEAPGK